MLTWSDSGIGFVYVKVRPVNEKDIKVLPREERLTWLAWTAYSAINALFVKHMSYERLHHYWLLAPLAEDGPRIQRNLAKTLRVKQSALVLLLDKLEERGWIVRSLPQDRRAKIITLTAAGRQYLSELNRDFISAQQEIAKQFAPSEWQQGLRFLWHLIPNGTAEAE